MPTDHPLFLYTFDYIQVDEASHAQQRSELFRHVLKLIENFPANKPQWAFRYSIEYTNPDSIADHCPHIHYRIGCDGRPDTHDYYIIAELPRLPNELLDDTTCNCRATFTALEFQPIIHALDYSGLTEYLTKRQQADKISTYSSLDHFLTNPDRQAPPGSCELPLNRIPAPPAVEDFVRTLTLANSIFQKRYADGWSPWGVVRIEADADLKRDTINTLVRLAYKYPEARTVWFISCGLLMFKSPETRNTRFCIGLNSNPKDAQFRLTLSLPKSTGYDIYKDPNPHWTDMLQVQFDASSTDLLPFCEALTKTPIMNTLIDHETMKQALMPIDLTESLAGFNTAEKLI